MNQARLRLRVTVAAEARLRSGHPWLFADSIRARNRDGNLGELAIIYDRKDRFLAVGLFDSESPIRVRVLHSGRPETIDRSWWSRRLKEAIERRKDLFDDQTTGFRLVNGESDGWPGLVLDRYEATLVLKLYTAAWIPRLKDLCGLIEEQLCPERIVLRLSRNVQAALVQCQPIQEAAPAREGIWADGQVLRGPPIYGPVIFLETGLRFEAEVQRGQKTGFFLDQRENRRKVETLARGRSVLNAFSFSGGFSVYAARGGARSVTDLDISAHALSAADRNFELNRLNVPVNACPRERIQADAFDWLAAQPKQRYDLIVLDPPSLAKREAEREGAVRAYFKLALLGCAHLRRGGILVACSCSAHVSADEFFAAVRNAASRSGRKFRPMETSRHPPDHPATFAEAHYLKAIYLGHD